MSEQDYRTQEENQDSSKEEYDYAREPEPDVYTLRNNEQRSRYFLAAMSFLLALLCLSAYLNHLPSINSSLLQLGAIVFAAIGIFFLLRSRVAYPHSYTSTPKGNQRSAFDDELIDDDNDAYDVQDDDDHNKVVDGYADHRDKEAVSLEYAQNEADGEGHELTPFELLVQEALATIPAEFQERMDNVFVRVVYEPGAEVLRRVGTKEGYTLLGLYEGVPLTTYGQRYSAQPETITIYQRTIENYCHGDSNRIREQVRHTVLHEVAHHFGIDHDEMPIWIR
jgi:predicted Zn-dependent protease with MMP-like domain